MLLKSCMNFLKHVARPLKLRSVATLVGLGHSVKALVFVSDARMPFALM